MPLRATRTLGTGDGWDITDSGIYVPDWADLNDVRPGSIIENPDRQPIRRRGLQQRGLWIHMGRVNSLRRLAYAASIGCHSIDGTQWGPLPRYLPPRRAERLRRRNPAPPRAATNRRREIREREVGSPRTSHRRRSAIARGRGDSANICS